MPSASNSSQEERPSTLRDPLSDVTRKERRSLLGASLVAAVVAKTGLVPTKIESLGIDFSTSDQALLLKSGAVVVAYFLTAFTVYGAIDLVAWRVAILKARGIRLAPQRGDVLVKVRTVFEFALPILSGAYALYALWAAWSNL